MGFFLFYFCWVVTTRRQPSRNLEKIITCTIIAKNERNMPLGVKKISRNEDLIRLAKNGDEDAKRELFIINDRFFHHIAKKWNRSGIEYDDLLSIARLGMFKAYRAFDPDKGIQFITYASRCMENEILMVLRRDKKHNHVLSFSNTTIHNKYHEEWTIEEYLGEDDKRFEEIDNKEIIKQVLNGFLETATAKQKEILISRFLNQEDMTQKELSVRMGLSQSYIARIEKKIAERLRFIANNKGMKSVDYYKSKEEKEVSKTKLNIPNFVYLIQNYPNLKQKDISMIFGVEPGTGLLSRYIKSYNNGEYEAVIPEAGNMDELVAKHIREYYPEMLAGPVVTKKEGFKVEEPVIKIPKEEFVSVPDKIMTPMDYMKKIINGESITITDESLKDMLVSAITSLGVTPKTQVKTEWTIAV